MGKLNFLFRYRCPLHEKVGQKYYSQRHGYAASLVEHMDESEIQAKYQPLERLPMKTPFVKNLFRGKFDTDMLAFPEFLPQPRIDLLESNVNVVQKLLEDDVDSEKINEKAEIPQELFEKLRALKLFGLTAPRSSGGAEFTHTERARIMEVIGADPSVAVLLFQHELVSQRLIARYGDDIVKKRFLNSLSTGKMYATLCYGEAESGSDAIKFETYATRSGTDWHLNGTKVWVMNADKADLFVVVAKVRLVHDKPKNPYYFDEDSNETLSPEELGIFLVQKNAANISIGPRLDTVGLRGVSMHEVTFNNVFVPDNMVLAEFYKGYDIVKRLLTEDRYAIGCIATSSLRNALSEASEYCVQRHLHDTNLFNYEFAQRRLGKMLVNLYAMESTIYYTAGLMDMYEGQDCEVENAITKVFCTETALNTIHEAMYLMGGRATLKQSNFYRYWKDLRSLTLFDHHNDLYRSTIALNGLQYISNDVSEIIMENRNPLFFSFQNVRNNWSLKYYKGDEENPRLYLKLKEYLHPSLMYLADQLEYCVLRFDHAIMKTLSYLGPGTVHDQMYLRRIADCATCLYAMVAVLSRASRSYCIGTENAEHEMVIAETYVRDSHDLFKELVTGLQHGEYFVTDHNYKKLSKKTVESGEYFLPKPYTLNY